MLPKNLDGEAYGKRDEPFAGAQNGESYRAQAIESSAPAR